MANLREPPRGGLLLAHDELLTLRDLLSLRLEGARSQFFLQTWQEDPEARSFAHPLHWAAFYLTGV